MTTLVNIRNLNLAFGQRAIFKDAELTINKGDRIGLIGLNGQGKSTLFKILTKDVTPDQSTPAFEYETSNQKFDIFLIPQELDIKKYSHLTIEEFYLTFYPKLYELYFKMQKDIANEELIHQFEELGIKTSNLTVFNVKNFRGSMIKKIAIMTNDHISFFGILKFIFKALYRFNVEMVSRLIPQ